MKVAVASMLFLVALVTGQSAFGQGQRIAVLDLKKVFDNYAPFQREFAALNKEVDAAEADIKLRQADIEADQKRLAELSKDDPAYDDLRAKIGDNRDQLYEFASLYKSTFARKEARVYFDSHRAVMEKLQAYCRENDIDVVLKPMRDLRNVSDEDAADPNKVIPQFNREIIYTKQNLDITDDFLRFIERSRDGDTPQDKSKSK